MFNIVSDKEKIMQIELESKRFFSNQYKTDLTNSIVFVALAESGTIDDITATEHVELFSPWVTDSVYKIGDMRKYNEILYRCVQAHTSQSDWTPDVTVSLWTKVGDPTEEYPEWSQPIGAHDAYFVGDKVSYNNKNWTSSVDNNVWQPGIYGWEEVSE